MYTTFNSARKDFITLMYGSMCATIFSEQKKYNHICKTNDGIHQTEIASINVKHLAKMP